MNGRNNEEVIDLVFDIDGVIVPDDTISYDKYVKQENRQLLPDHFFNYHKKHTLGLMYENKLYNFILLPGMLELFQYIVVKLKNKVRVHFFSTGPEGRNIELINLLKIKVASLTGIHPDKIIWPVYSFQHCIELSANSELQPNSITNPHIPAGINLWNHGESCLKKHLYSIWGPDIRNVILIDNNYKMVICNETKNHLKTPTCTTFSGADFKKYRGTLMHEAKPLELSIQYLEEKKFYEGNLAFMIAGYIPEIILCMRKLKISASSALSLMQICPETNKYKPALTQKPIYEQYEPAYYYQGFCILQNLFPKLRLYAPYPDYALEALKLFVDEKQKIFIRYALMKETAQYWPPTIYHIINQYYGDFLKPASVSTDGFFSKSEPYNPRLNQREDEIPTQLKQSSFGKTSLSCAIL